MFPFYMTSSTTTGTWKITMYHWKTDLQTASIRNYANEEGRFVEQTIRVRNVKRNNRLIKLNFGYQFFSNNGITFDLSAGIGGSKNGTEASKNQYGSTKVIKHFVFDPELKVGYGF